MYTIYYKTHPSTTKLQDDINIVTIFKVTLEADNVCVIQISVNAYFLCHLQLT